MTERCTRCDLTDEECCCDLYEVDSDTRKRAHELLDRWLDSCVQIARERYARGCTGRVSHAEMDVSSKDDNRQLELQFSTMTTEEV